MNAKDKILKYIQENKQARPDELARYFGLSRQIIHRVLAELVKNSSLEKIGRPPRVYYVISTQSKDVISHEELDKKTVITIDEKYLNVTASGEILRGVEGFYKWCQKQSLNFSKTAEQYVQTLRKYENLKRNGLIDGMPKLEQTFEKVYLDELYYMDFYSIERFGKTKLGSQVYLAKVPNRNMIDEVISAIKPKIGEIIERKHVAIIGFVPPSAQRSVQLMKEMQKELSFGLPVLPIRKITKDVTILQKSLKKLEDRVENARETIIVDTIITKPGSILIIDDAVGSGATLNEIARKIKEQMPQYNNRKNKVIGFVPTGSFKGFDVLPVV